MPYNSFPTANRQWLLGGVALVVATGVGFTAAKLTGSTSAPAADAAAEAQAESRHAPDAGRQKAEAQARRTA